MLLWTTMRSSGRSTLPTCRRSSTRAATTNSQRHVKHPAMSAKSTGRVHRSRRTMHKVVKPVQHQQWCFFVVVFVLMNLVLCFIWTTLLVFTSREASVPWNLPRQLCYRLLGTAEGGKWVHQRAVPSWDAHLHIPATRSQRLQRGL